MKRNIDIEKLCINEGQIEGLPKNPRFIKDEKYKKLIQSIKDDPEMLNLRELLVYKLNGEYVVVAGNMRLRVLKELGYTNALCKIINAETPPEKLRAIAIKDNLGYGEDDWMSLMENWDREELEDWGVDVEKNWPVEGPIAEEDDYEIPDEIETDIHLGDIFQIGEHRLMCGDSTDADQVAKLMDGQKADMVFTDPPYNVAYGVDSKNPRYTAHVSGKHRAIENDKQDETSWVQFNIAIASILHIFCCGDIYVWGAPGPDGMRQRLIFIDNGIHWSATIIWKKNRLVLAAGKYQRMYEPCFYGWINKSSFVADRKQVEVWEYDRPSVSELHPTMKPISLCSNGIVNSCKEHDIVLDLFLGSGSTMVASHQLNRKCYGMEIDPHYCQVIIDRMKALDPEIEIKKLNS
jgi:DNA modification methylase